MRILTVVAGMGVGGTERAAQNLTLGLKALGAEVAVLAHAEGGPREAGLSRGGDRGIRAGEADAAAAGWGADVVHIHRTGYANARETALMRVLKAPGVKVVETNVFARFDAGEGGGLIDAHCLLSRWCAYKWSAWGGAAARGASAMQVLPNPVDPGGIGRVPDACREALRADSGFRRGGSSSGGSASRTRRSGRRGCSSLRRGARRGGTTWGCCWWARRRTLAAGGGPAAGRRCASGWWRCR